MTSNTEPPLKRENNKKHALPNPHSITGVNPVRSHGFGIWGNPRVVFGVRVDSELKKRFVSAAKRVFGSTCSPVESFMAAIVGCVEQAEKLGVNPSKTVSIEIGEIKIERNLRERRRLVVEEAKPIAVAAPQVKCDFCGHVPAVEVFRHVSSGIQKRACDYHAGILKNHTKWETVNDTTQDPAKGSEEKEK